jgi:hypothetical protein
MNVKVATNLPEELTQWSHAIAKMFPPGVSWAIAIVPEDPSVSTDPLLLSNLPDREKLQTLLRAGADKAQVSPTKL